MAVDDEVAQAIEAGSERTWALLRTRARAVESFAAALKLSTLRRRARARNVPPEAALEPLRVAIVGGSGR